MITNDDNRTVFIFFCISALFFPIYLHDISNCSLHSIINVRATLNRTRHMFHQDLEFLCILGARSFLLVLFVSLELRPPYFFGSPVSLLPPDFLSKNLLDPMFAQAHKWKVKKGPVR